RAAFFLVVPLALVTATLGIWRVPNPPVLRRAPAIDWGGALLSTIGIAGVISAIILAPADRVSALCFLSVGVLALIGFPPHAPRPRCCPRAFFSRLPSSGSTSSRFSSTSR